MKKALSFSILALLALAQDYPEVSRLGKNIKLLLQVTSPGASTPEVLFNKTKDPKEEPKIANYLTPLGQRQQYLVGTEYRLRYVDEQQNQFLNYSYDINELWIQTTFDQKTILSAQAQLIGLYPPQTYNNFLNSWQQGNAIPPLNNTDNSTWSHWQAELGHYAVLDGFNVFPINMVGADQDFLLNLNSQNCPLFNKSLTNTLDYDNYAEFLVRLSALFNSHMFDVPTGYAACQYVMWADLHSIDLTVNYTEDDLKSCNQLMNDAAKVYVDTNFKLQNIASNDFLQKVHDYVSTAIGEQDYKKSKHFAELTARYRKNDRLMAEEMNANNANHMPDYIFYATTDINLQMFVSSLVGKDNLKNIPSLRNHIVPSSSLILEVIETDGKYYIEAHLNDQKIPLVACGESNPCQAGLLTQYLHTNIHYTDVATACQVNQQQVKKEFIQ